MGFDCASGRTGVPIDQEKLTQLSSIKVFLKIRVACAVD
jgi:hypothetical protein